MVDVCLPSVSGTPCLVPRNCSENKQEAVFLPGGIREDFMGGEIFKERERHGEKSPRRMIKHGRKLGSPPSPHQDLACPFQGFPGGSTQAHKWKPPAT